MPAPRVSKTVLNRIFGKSQRAVFLLDSDQRIVFANPTAEKAIGFSLQELITVQCEYESSPLGSQSDLQFAVNGICPTPECFFGTDHWATIRLGPSNQPQFFVADFFALGENWLPSSSNTEPSSSNNEPCEPVVNNPESAVLVIVGGPMDKQWDPSRRLQGKLNMRDLNSTLHQCLQQVDHFWTQHGVVNDPEIKRFVGASPANRLLLAKSKVAMDSSANVVVIGRSGSGRRLLLRTISKNRSPATRTSNEPRPISSLMLTIDGAIAQPEMVQQTLKEMWSNAEVSQPPILLTNASQLNEASQHELFGLLELRNFETVVFSSTETSLIQMARGKQFHPDLASFLSPIEIEIEALASRIEDIPLLAQYFLEACNCNQGMQLSGIEDSALDALCQYRWFGETAELEEAIKHAAEKIRKSKSNRRRISLEDLPKKIELAIKADEFPIQEEEPINLVEHLRKIELDIIQQTVAKHKGNKAKAAEMLGIGRAKLIRRLESTGPDFREVETDEVD